MALSITPKSEVRRVRSISHGYGEVPIVIKGGKQGWALPGNVIIFSSSAALEAAKTLDTKIRSNLHLRKCFGN